MDDDRGLFLLLLWGLMESSGGGGSDWQRLKNSAVRSWDVMVLYLFELKSVGCYYLPLCVFSAPVGRGHCLCLLLVPLCFPCLLVSYLPPSFTSPKKS